MHSYAPSEQSESAEPFDATTVLQNAIEALTSRDGARAAELTGLLMAEYAAHPDVLYARAAALMACGDNPGGRAVLEEAARVHSLHIMQSNGVDLQRLMADGQYAMAVARKLYNAFHMGPAIVALVAGVADPEVAKSDGMFVLAQALHYQGRVEQAYRAFQAAYDLKFSPHMASFILYSLFFVENGPRRHAEAAREWARLWADYLTPDNPTFLVQKRADRRLRIGYMAPTFSRMQHRHFLIPLLDHHDSEKFEVFCYVEDETKEIPHEKVRFRSFKMMRDELTAAMIRADEIDVLVDCHGHCSGGRPRVFARKPAPVQVSWLNYFHTMGFKAMDYVIHAETMQADPSLFVEQIYDVGPIASPFRPDGVVKQSPLPARTKGYVTFGCFNHPAKVSNQTLAAWARVLHATPGSHLMLKYSPYTDLVLRAETSTRLLAHGISPSRLEFEGHTTGDAYEQAFAGIDIALDTSPCIGGTTSLEAVSRGIPVVTLRGDDFYARIGVQIPLALGLPDLIAETWDEYVDKAVALASDLDALEAMRTEMPSRLESSAYRDELGFTQRMETAYRTMFDAWLAGEAAQA